MVARLADLPAPKMPLLLGNASKGSESTFLDAQLTIMGHLLVERAQALEGAVVGGRPVRGIPGVPVRLEAGRLPATGKSSKSFIHARVFAVIGYDGSLCLRVCKEVADDLIENALAVRIGKNVVTWAPQNRFQLETQWQILRQAHATANAVPVRRMRRLWSEWVVNH